MMKLTIRKKGGGDAVTVDIEPGAKVSDLFLLLYQNREQPLEDVPLEVYQQILVLHLDDMYSEHFETLLHNDNTLSDYNINEESTLTLDYSNHEQYLLAIHSGDSAIISAGKVRTGFFAMDRTPVDPASFGLEQLGAMPPSV
ncbi:ubiquitin-like domain-containing protein [Legionella shakespearei]|nr:ubiquitin-like domain-containing protein [Legionella shakespearei]